MMENFTSTHSWRLIWQQWERSMDLMQCLSGMSLTFPYCGTFNILEIELHVDLPSLPKHKSSGDFCLLCGKRKEHCWLAIMLVLGWWVFLWLNTDITGCAENKPWKPVENIIVFCSSVGFWSGCCILLKITIKHYSKPSLNSSSVIFCLLSWRWTRRMIRDLVNVFPRERLKELDLSSLGKKRRSHNNSSSSEKLFVDRSSDQIFSIVIMKETIRNFVVLATNKNFIRF